MASARTPAASPNPFPPTIWLASIPALATIVVLALTLSTPDPAVMGDAATTSIFTLRALTEPLGYGAYSRFPWHHPGPAVFYLLAPGYWLSGFREVTHHVTAMCLNLGCLVGLFWIVHREEPRAVIALTLVLCPFLFRSGHVLWSEWNPLLAVVPLLLLMFSAAAAATGRVWLVPLVAALASFVVQAHVGYTAVVSVILAIAVGTGLAGGVPVV